jgi:hypothetical protein
MNGNKNSFVVVSECPMMFVIGKFHPARLGIEFCDVHEDGNGEIKQEFEFPNPMVSTNLFVLFVFLLVYTVFLVLYAFVAGRFLSIMKCLRSKIVF